MMRRLRMLLKRPPLIIDNCVLSDLLSGECFELLKQLYSNKIIIPNEVYKEGLQFPPLKSEYENIIEEDWYEVKPIEKKEDLFLFNSLHKRFKGNGEASVLTLAQRLKGTVCSNDLRAVKKYTDIHDIPLMTTMTILYDAYKKEIITKKQGQKLLDKMITDGRDMVVDDFQKVVDSFERGIGKPLY